MHNEYPNAFILDILIGESKFKVNIGLSKLELYSLIFTHAYISRQTGAVFAMNEIEAISIGIKFAKELIKQSGDGK